MSDFSACSILYAVNVRLLDISDRIMSKPAIIKRKKRRLTCASGTGRPCPDGVSKRRTVDIV
jgi:hypothetical protein